MRIIRAALGIVCSLAFASSLRADLYLSEAAKVERYTLAGTDLGQFGAAPFLTTGLVRDGQGNIYAGAVGPSGDIYKFTSGGTRTTFATTANGSAVDPFGLALDGQGDLLAVDRLQNNIDVFSPAGVWTSELLSGYSMPSPDYLAIDAGGNLFVSNDNTGEVDEFAPTGAFIQKITTDLTTAYGIHFDASGHLWVLDQFSSVIREYSISGATSAEIGSWTLSNVNAVDFAFDQNGKLYVLSLKNGPGAGYLQSYASNGAAPVKIATLSSNNPGYLLDTTAVVPTPEPSSVLPIAAGMLLLFAAHRKPCSVHTN